MNYTFNASLRSAKAMGGVLQFGAAQMLVANTSAPQVFYDVTPDGKRF